jgi:glycine/D-amino acid oxidase-like deaminating enzyme
VSEPATPAAGSDDAARSEEAARSDEAAGAATAPETGHPRIDAALAALAAAAQQPPAEQIDVYDAVHRTLQETLGTIDEG